MSKGIVNCPKTSCLVILDLEIISLKEYGLELVNTIFSFIIWLQPKDAVRKKNIVSKYFFEESFLIDQKKGARSAFLKETK